MFTLLSFLFIVRSSHYVASFVATMSPRHSNAIFDPVTTTRFFASISQDQQQQQQQQEIISNNSPPFPFQLHVAKSKWVNGVVSRSGPLNEAVAKIANVTLEQACELIELGAVWARMELLSEDDLLAQYDDNHHDASSSRALYADLGDTVDWYKHGDDVSLQSYIDQVESLRYRRILQMSTIETGTDLRIYPEPRRFPVLMSREHNLLYEDTTFVIVDKPPMLPTQPDASNYRDCCPGVAQTTMGPFYNIDKQIIDRPLLCHRVDACVGGCVVMSKDRNGQKVFQELQRERKIRKLYLAVTKKPVPLGMNIQWMWYVRANATIRSIVKNVSTLIFTHTLCLCQT
jgi:23S rRNA-/tRNA-specific pseudouridylate synthase